MAVGGGAARLPARVYPPGAGTDTALDPDEPPVEREAAAEPSIAVASQWKLTWWRFRRNKLALVGAAVLVLIYASALFAPFLAPFSTEAYDPQYVYAPPQRLHLFDTDDGFAFRLHVSGYRSELDPASLRRTFVPDPEQEIPVRLFVRGEEYRLFGLIPTDRHLIGPVDPTQPMYLLGADRLGRDLLSLLIFGTRISMSIGLAGVFLSFILGILLGGVSGYYGGFIDNIVQRLIEFLGSVPTLPLWLGLSAALPPWWSPLQVYFGISIILSLVGWTGMARVVRGRFLSLREEDFVLAARLYGAGELRIILRHMLPSFTSHIIASLTLAIPGMILGETALSFLGLGLRDPVVSWGVLLQGAQNLRVVATAPWLLLPAAAVVVTVMALYLMGDGLRDAADPYAN
jgi:peptide/nickel transport system permease protein